MKTIRATLSAILIMTAAGCAATLPPQDLVTARMSYDRASRGPAVQLDPADLRTAKESLDLAEQSFAANGDTQETRDLAYLADRRTQIAEARAGAVQATGQKQQTIANMHASEVLQVKTTTAQLGEANETIARQGLAMQSQNQQLLTERERRLEANRRSTQAAADLAKFASVKQEARGMVITLSGSVLFASAKSDLLPGAQLKLNDVADALTKQDPDSKIVVEGHTDSQGGTAYNQDLSQQRAQVVRDYIVSRGISPDRVTAQGFGMTRSVANNTSAEGRANNRRVEIVVKTGPASAPLSRAGAE